MRKRLLQLILVFTLVIPVIPIPSLAFGGYFVVTGLNGYHSALCECLDGYDINDVKWYKTLKDVQKTGLNPAQCCQDNGYNYDYIDDDASRWNIKDEKIKNIFEIERMWGVISGYDLGVAEGYDLAYSDGYNNGESVGYENGYNDAEEKLTAEIESLESSFDRYMILSGVVFLVFGFFYIQNNNTEKEALKKQKQEAEKQFNSERREILEWKQTELHRIAEEERRSSAHINSQRSLLQRDIELFQKAITETKQSNPALASQIADAQYYLDMRSYNQLLNQKRPALKAAEEVKKIAGEKRELMKENRQLQYQLDFYEKLFPWLEEFKEVPSDEAVSYATGSYGSEYDAVKKWLSPEEYEKLSNADKYQRALNRWKSRNKSDWDIGIEYERYIGYKLECDGYKVSYIGATLGLKDMGRDLLATKDGKTLIIQCKRWAKEKTIHEKHLFQLYGSTAVYATEHPGTQCKAVFITTTTLSDTAKKCAEYCGIAVVENCPIGEYPLIKCNANKEGEKIYHLPFDQQYDKVVISKNKQSCYAWTTYEAEELGFRRAYRWHPNKS